MNNPVQRFFREVSECTHGYLTTLPTRHCLCSSSNFAVDLLATDLKNNAIEWAETQQARVTKGYINIPIQCSGHILSAIFVPVECSLSVHISTDQSKYTYYFDSDFNNGGSKYSLYIPLICCGSLNLRIVIKINKYENKDIPLTFFYINLKAKEILYNKIANYIENKFIIACAFPDRLTFIIKGRFNPDNYRCYIHGNIKNVTVGNFEMVELYTFERKRLCGILASNFGTISILD